MQKKLQLGELKLFLTSKFSDSIWSIFEFKKVWIITPTLQVVTVIFLYIVSLYLGYQEFLTKGTFQGYNPNEAFSLIFVPIWEEFIFRGLILVGIWKYQPVWIAVIVSAFLFGIRHYINLFYGGSLASVNEQVIYAGFIFAPILGVLTVKTRSVWPAIILHFLNNLLVLYFL